MCDAKLLSRYSCRKRTFSALALILQDPVWWSNLNVSAWSVFGLSAKYSMEPAGKSRYET